MDIISKTDETVTKLREIRARENITIKPSSYLKSSFIDEYGDEHSVILRNYQKQMIVNLLMSEKFLCGEDTGLGKTLEILTVIGYIWDVEPNYIPIVITTKSALFQWVAETRKFMHNMEAIPVFGEPFERQSIYEEFFLKHDQSKKRLIIMTYDTVMRDLEPSVVKDRSLKVPADLKKELKEARRILQEDEVRIKEEQEKFDQHFQESIFDTHEYIRDQMLLKPEGRPVPPNWNDSDRSRLEEFKKYRKKFHASTKIHQELSDRAAPPRRVPGIIDYVRDLKESKPDTRFMVIMDEMHKLKNHKSQFHQKVHTLSLECQRIYGMTATPVKNRLMEFWSLFRVLKPNLFPKVTHFQNEFCITKLQPIGGGRKVPVIVGYKNLEEFVRRIEPYYLSRKKHEVAKELPQLISREVECELYDLQEELYDMAEAGLMEDIDESESSGQVLSSMVMIQQASNSPYLLSNEEGEQFEGPSSKIDALMDLLLDEAEGQKVIVFSRFEKMISLIGKTLDEAKWEDESGKKRTGIKYVRVTGKENNPKLREEAKNKFQDTKSGVNIILITTAGSESINLQSAEHFVFIDLPWSTGDYLQLIGRMVRIGSSHKIVTAHHFLARKTNGKKTIDHHVLSALRNKKKLMDKVAGDGLVGGLQFNSNNIAIEVANQIQQETSNGVKSRKKSKSESNGVKNRKKSKPESKTMAGHVMDDQYVVNTIDIDIESL